MLPVCLLEFLLKLSNVEIKNGDGEMREVHLGQDFNRCLKSLKVQINGVCGGEGKKRKKLHKVGISEYFIFKLLC